MESTVPQKATAKKNHWQVNENNYFLEGITNSKPVLPIGVYRLSMTPVGQMYLKYTEPKFEFKYKVYGIEADFIARVVKTYHATKGNLGILLNGLKGTGKTVTAEIICNKLELPVIIVSANFEGATPAFLNSLEQDVIVFFDEYEKIYDDYDHSILTVMDGVLNNGYRKTFILTTNKLYINDNMLSRPSRIRYMKEFKDLASNIINEIVDDMLVHTAHKEAIIKYISSLKIITVDIVKSIIEEVNIHNEAPDLFKKVFNVKQSDDKFDIWDVTNPTQAILIIKNATIQPKGFDGEVRNIIDHQFYINYINVGKIVKVLNTETIAVEFNEQITEAEYQKTKSETEADINKLSDVFFKKPTLNVDEDGLGEEIGEESPVSPMKALAGGSINGAAITKKAPTPVRHKKVTKIIKIEQSYSAHYAYYWD